MVVWNEQPKTNNQQPKTNNQQPTTTLRESELQQAGEPCTAVVMVRDCGQGGSVQGSQVAWKPRQFL
ncbi:MAG: hypothetical protein ACHBN1_06235 [Heteroscytonema crispum UTEX LB 1556]